MGEKKERASYTREFKENAVRLVADKSTSVSEDVTCLRRYEEG